MACHLTHTTAATHALIAANLAETPVYGGWVDAVGPRYCPSIEDKIVRFADKPSHQARLLHVGVTNVLGLGFSVAGCVELPAQVHLRR